MCRATGRTSACANLRRNGRTQFCCGNAEFLNLLARTVHNFSEVCGAELGASYRGYASSGSLNCIHVHVATVAFQCDGCVLAISTMNFRLS